MILVTYGTRPEYIKIKPLIKEMNKCGIKFKTLFTGQHKDIISDLEPDFKIDMIEMNSNRLNSVFMNCLNIDDKCFDNISHILVQGDTTSVVALSINAMNRGIEIIHLEAGLRSFDTKNPFPEEYNRKIVSSIADIHLCPTDINKKNLENESITENIYIVGNTALDNLKIFKDKCIYDNRVLITLHRRENLDNIEEWFKEINYIASIYTDIEFILPIHPNPNVQKYKYILTNVVVVNQLEHIDLLKYLISSKIIITDSGGIQEECSFFNKLCLVCRKVTERPEALNKTSFLISEPSKLKSYFEKYIKDDNYIMNSDNICPYGNGDSSEKICEIFKNLPL